MPDTKISALTAVATPADTDEFAVNQAGTSKKMTLSQVRSDHFSKRLTADLTNSTATMAKVTGLDLSLGIGTYIVQYFLRYQSQALTTGVRFSVNYTGTSPVFVFNMRWVDASATASTAAPDQDEILTTGAVVGAFAARLKSTLGWGTTISVDSVNADMLMIVEGLVQATSAGDLQLYHASEVAAASIIKAESSLLVNKIG